MKRNTPYVSQALIFFFLLFVFACKKDDDCKPATSAKAGTDQSVVSSTATLDANAPESGTGSWSITSGAGGSFTDNLNPKTTFSGAVGTTYVLKWAISGCPASEDEVQVTFSCNPNNAANAGPDQNVAGTSATLAANTVSGATGTWSIVSGTGGSIATPSSPTSSFSGVVGNTYVLKWTVSCPASQDEVQIKFNDGTPQITSVDKTSVLNGEIITVFGVNFAANFQGGAQIVAVKNTDPLKDQQLFLSVISRTATEVKVVMQGANGGAVGAYNLRYNKKPDANAGTLIASTINVEIVAPTANQFYTSQAFSSTSAGKGGQASFGVKNGSLNAGDYTVKLVKYDFATGTMTEYDVSGVTLTANGFDSSMDNLAFTVPASVPSATFSVKVTYGGKTLMGGWGSILNVN